MQSSITSASSALRFDVGGVGNIVNSQTGYIVSGLSTRPDDKFYDGILASDVEDLRMDANKPTDLTRTLTKEFNRAVAGEKRGFEGVPFTRVVGGSLVSDGP